MQTRHREPDLRKPRAGQVVQVRSAAEILATLDERGELDALPFMPEMLPYCGQRLRIDKVAHKLCDTMTRSGMRRMNDAVHLADTRCDGSAHDGCQAACLMYWKLAWLKPVPPQAADTTPAPDGPGPFAQSAADHPRLLPLLTAATRSPSGADGEPRYRCQATELLRAAPSVLPVRDLRQYVDDVRTGNVGPLWTLRAFAVAVFNGVQRISVARLPRWLWFRGGRPWRFLRGRAGRTPAEVTNLQPGEWVRIKSRDEIMQTLNHDLLNRGLGFDPEMARFCGRTARVARRATTVIEETTGRMLQLRNPCIVLEGVVCEGAYNVSCPRAITPYWREIWLERVAGPTSVPTSAGPA